MVSCFTPDGYYVNGAGAWVPIADDELKLDGLRLISSYFYITLPESWLINIGYYSEKNYWSLWYSHRVTTESGKMSADILDIFAFDDKTSYTKSFSELDNAIGKNQHAGKWFLTGHSKSDIVDISLYHKEQQEEILKLRSEASSIVDSMVFRK